MDIQALSIIYVGNTFSQDVLSFSILFMVQHHIFDGAEHYNSDVDHIFSNVFLQISQPMFRQISFFFLFSHDSQVTSLWGTTVQSWPRGEEASLTGLAIAISPVLIGHLFVSGLHVFLQTKAFFFYLFKLLGLHVFFLLKKFYYQKHGMALVLGLDHHF